MQCDFYAKYTNALIICLLIFSQFIKYADAAEICVRSPFAAYIAYAYVQPINGEWETEGWWRKEPGECLSLKESKHNTYYYYADVANDDIVAEEWKSTSLSWGGSEKDKTSARLCVKSSAFHMYSDGNKDDCNANDRYEYFKKIDTQGNSSYTHALTVSKAKKILGFSIDTNEQAAAVARALKGQILYGRDIGKDPKGTPFRTGIEIEADQHGVYITKVSPGMPADGILYPGDRLIKIGDTKIATVYDAIFTIQNIGLSHSPSERTQNSKFVVYRWYDLEKAPLIVASTLDFAYYRTLDTRVADKSVAEAASRSFVDSILWGFSPEVECIARSIKETFIDEKAKHQRDKYCADRKRKERDELREVYPDTVQLFDFAGAMFSPRLLVKSLARKGARNRMARVGIAMLDEAAQGGITVIGQASSKEDITPPEIAKGIILGAGIGAGTAIIFGK